MMISRLNRLELAENVKNTILPCFWLAKEANSYIRAEVKVKFLYTIFSRIAFEKRGKKETLFKIRFKKEATPYLASR